MKYYHPPLKINLFVRFILILAGTMILLMSVIAIFGGNTVVENGIELNESDARWFRLKWFLSSVFIGGSMLLITENIKYSLMTFGIGVFAFLSLIFIPLIYSLDLKTLLTWKMVGFIFVYVIPFYLFPCWLFYLEFKKR